MERAFETIEQNILLIKLQEYDIKDTEIKWIRSFLSNRKQKIVIENSISNEKDITIGLPLGSGLAPLLFVLYINDINESLKYSRIKMFADDTLIFVSGKNIETPVNKINDDLKSLHEWLNANGLKLNI